MRHVALLGLLLPGLALAQGGPPKLGGAPAPAAAAGAWRFLPAQGGGGPGLIYDN